jgi:uncharacterized protein
MRTVLDTNVVISSLLWGGAPSRLLKRGPGVGVQLFSSEALLTELRETLRRPKFQKRLLVSSFSADELVDLYADRITLVEPASTPRLAPDPDDDVVIGTAWAAKADLIVTGDRGLLSVASFRGGRIVSVLEALALHDLTI